jgi:hypothetical protein
MMRNASAQTPQSEDIEKPEESDTSSEQLIASDDLELTIEGDEEVEVQQQAEKVEKAAPPEKKEEDEAAALRKQLDELRGSEELNKREMQRMQQEREAAVAARQKAEQEASRYRLEGEQSQLDAIMNAMAAAKAEADAAEQLLETAITEQDAKKQAEAHRRLAKAETNLSRLDDGKTELEYRISLLQRPKVEEKRAEPEKAAAAPQQQDPIESLQMPDRAKEWLREHPEYIQNPRLNARLQVAHWDAIEAGHKEFSTGYFAEIEKLVGLTKVEPKVEEAEADDDDVEVDVREPVRTQTKEPRRSAIVSAPVSRESSATTPASSRTQVKLTKEEADFAKMAGITPQEYAKQKLKLQEMKRKGEIQ